MSRQLSIIFNSQLKKKLKLNLRNIQLSFSLKEQFEIHLAITVNY